MNVMEKKEALIGELASLELAEVKPASQVCAMLLDENVEFAPPALAFSLKSLGIPHSYFKRVSEEHKREVVRNAQFEHADASFRVLQSGPQVKAVGPNIEYSSRQLADFIKGIPDEVGLVKGSLFEGMGVASMVFKRGEFALNEKYFYGMMFELSSLFSMGIRMCPAVIQVLCINGLMDVMETNKYMKLTPFQVSNEYLEYGLAASNAIIDRKRVEYENLLDACWKKPFDGVAAWPSLRVEVSERQFPESFLEKINYYVQMIAANGQRELPLPAQISNYGEMLSVFTYAAQQFSVRSATRMEGLSYVWAKTVVN